MNDVPPGPPNAPIKPGKPDVPPKLIVPPRVAPRPVIKLSMVNGRGVVNGTVTSSNGKIGSARTLPARISKELEEVLSAAETPLVGCDKGEETRKPLSNLKLAII